jgi:rSAM/selenodomain-associated transferase 2
MLQRTTHVQASGAGESGAYRVQDRPRLKLSIIGPVLNEAPNLTAFLQRLMPLRLRGAEVIVVDGGSCDRSVEVARSNADWVINSPRGRAKQMNAGAAVARGNILLFLHADTSLPNAADSIIISAISEPSKVWGRFDATIDSRHPLLNIVGRLMNFRSRISGIATGDQAIFVRRRIFEAVGGYEDIPLMEDVALSRTLKRIGHPVCLRERVVTSGRRWHEHGVVRTIFLMWKLRLAYFLGADPNVLARRYGYVPYEE